jgi:phenylpyruvate tautomerase PptA (4-oxalocrotonate tautomerase family)
MPIARIDLRQGKSQDYLRSVGEVVYQSMTKLLGVPEGGRFQIITEHPDHGFHVSADYSGIERTADAIILQVTVNAGKTNAMKKAFYRGVCDGLHDAVGLRREDIFINLLEVAKENWSTGNGIMNYEDNPTV